MCYRLGLPQFWVSVAWVQLSGQAGRSNTVQVLGQAIRKTPVTFASAAILDSRSRGIQSLTSFDHGNSRETGVSNCCGSRMCSSKRLGERAFVASQFLPPAARTASYPPWITPDLHNIHDVSRRHLVCTLPTRLTLNKERSEQVTFFILVLDTRSLGASCTWHTHRVRKQGTSCYYSNTINFRLALYVMAAAWSG